MAPKGKLKSIREGAFSRGFALARMSMRMSAAAAGQAVAGVFGAGDHDPRERLKKLLKEQAGFLADELGKLKGSVMKVGQMLSMVGEHVLPPEANQLLKSLQSQSPPLEWLAIEKALKRQLGEKLAALEVESEHYAAASLGQVHRARIRESGHELALKIQYPGVDKAIDGDLKALRSILSVAKLFPTKSARVEDIFREVRAMLHQEVDYEREAELTREYREGLADDPRYIVPEVITEFSTKRVLATSFERGVGLDSPEVRALPEERRTAIASMLAELFYRELFQWRRVQSDPHFGNFRVRIGPPDRLVLLDFGAVRKFSKEFVDGYREMALGIVLPDRALMERAARRIGYLTGDEKPEFLDKFWRFCLLLLEPLAEPGRPGSPPSRLLDSEGRYLWGASDLAKRVAAEVPGLALDFTLKPPPRETVFLDRKLAGLFFQLSALDVRLRLREVVLPYLKG